MEKCRHVTDGQDWTLFRKVKVEIRLSRGSPASVAILGVVVTADPCGVSSTDS